MGRRGRASACPRSRTGQVIWLAAALLLLAIAVLALWLYETNGAPDGQSAETRQVPPIPPAGGEGLPPAVRNGQAVVQTVADTAAVVSTTAPTDADDGNIVYYRRRNDRMEIALSFDDGPHPTYTQEILSILAEYGVPATFFMVGENVLYYPEAAEAVLAAGHEIGNHSYDHRRLTKLNEAGVTVRRVARAEGYRLILWDIDTRDWAHTPPDTITRNVLESVQAGDIILMHDYIGHDSPTPAALRRLIPALLERGYRFVTVSRLIDG